MRQGVQGRTLRRLTATSTLHRGEGPGFARALCAIVLALVPAACSASPEDSEPRGAAPTTPAPAASVFEVGGFPNGIAFAAGNVWVVDPEPGSLTPLDPEDGTVGSSAKLGGGSFMAVAKDGELWISRHLAGDVQRVDAASGTVRGEIPVGAFPEELSIHAGSVWVVGDEARSIYEIDAATERARRVVKVRGEIEGFAVDETGVWLTLYGRDDLLPFTLGGKDLAPVPVGSGPTDVETAHGRVWVANTAEGTVTVLDPATRAATGLVETGGAPRNMAYLHDRLWVSDSGDGIVYEVDPVTNEVRTHEVPGPVVAFAASPDAVWATSGDAGAVVRIEV